MNWPLPPHITKQKSFTQTNTPSDKILSLGDLINPDRLSTYIVIELTFNQIFWSKFLARFLIIKTKSIKLCPDYIEKIEIDRNILKRDQNRSKMI